MLTITRWQRSLLLFVSASCYIAWLAGIGERLNAQNTHVDDLSIARRTTPPSAVTRAILRDPFAGAPNATDRKPASISSFEASSDPLLSPSTEENHGNPTVPDLLPDAGPLATARAHSLTGDASADLAVAVRATLVGDPALAYVQTQDGLVIARIGDRLGPSRIAKIDLRGITLADGTRYSLAERHREPQRISHKPGLSDKIDALRALVSRAIALPASSPSGTIANATPTATPTAIVTPGPLPTIVPNALPVGVSPTANAYGPTPYPVPQIHTYPYPE